MKATMTDITPAALSKLDKKLRKCRDIIETTLNDSTLWQPSRRSVEWVQRYIIEAMDLLDVLPAPHPPAPDAAVEAAVLAERERILNCIKAHMRSKPEDGETWERWYLTTLVLLSMEVRTRSAAPKPGSGE